MLSIVIIIIIKRELHTAYRASTGSYKSSIYLPHASRDSQSTVSNFTIEKEHVSPPFTAPFFLHMNGPQIWGELIDTMQRGSSPLFI